MHDVAIDNIPSKPMDTQHSWTYPGFGCGVVLRPQFSAVGAVRAGPADRLLQGRARSTGHAAADQARAEAEATQTIRDNFIQPTVNAFGYTLDRFTVRWAASPPT